MPRRGSPSSDASDSREVFTRASVDLDAVARINEQRDLHGDTGLEGGRLACPRHPVALDARLGIGDDELALWQDMSRRMFVPFHGDGIISQFEGYGDLQELDWDAYRAKYENIQRLDRILRAEGDDPNRYKITKQADTVMLFFLFSGEELREIFGRLGYDYRPGTAARNVAIRASVSCRCFGSSAANVAPLDATKPTDMPRSRCNSWTARLAVSAKAVAASTSRPVVHTQVPRRNRAKSKGVGPGHWPSERSPAGNCLREGKTGTGS